MFLLYRRANKDPVVGWAKTVTLKPPIAVLPCASVASQLTGVVPIGNVLPEAGVQMTATAPSMASSAVATKSTSAPAGEVAGTERSVGSVSTGATLSTTVTLKPPDAV